MSGDKELFEMMKKRSQGGQLPGKAVRFIPEERADRVIALDERIQKLQQKLPGILFLLILLFTFLAGRAL